MLYCGVDYSLTCPAICKHYGTEWNYKNCTFYYLIGTKKYQIKTNQYCGQGFQKYSINEERYHNNAQWAKNIIGTEYQVFIEDYSLHSEGKVFNLAENCGILKYTLWLSGVKKYELVPPTVIKKFATERGKANKEKMYEYWLNDTGVNLLNLFETDSIRSPISDIVDAYWICKYGFSKGNPQ